MHPDEMRAVKDEVARSTRSHSWQSATVVSYRPFSGRGGVASVVPDGTTTPIEAVNTTGQELAPLDRVQLMGDPPAGVYVAGIVKSTPAAAGFCPPIGGYWFAESAQLADSTYTEIPFGGLMADANGFDTVYAQINGSNRIEILTSGLYLMWGTARGNIAATYTTWQWWAKQRANSLGGCDIDIGFDSDGEDTMTYVYLNISPFIRDLTAGDEVLMAMSQTNSGATALNTGGNYDPSGDAQAADGNVFYLQYICSGTAPAPLSCPG